jgi:hypothetical protein
MTIDSVEQIHDLTYIHDNYIVSHAIDGSDYDTHGWVKATVSNFEIDGEEIDMVIELPWGETHRYGWTQEEIVGGPLSMVCRAFDYDLSEFERLQGEDIWLMVKYIEIEDGEIDSGTRMTYTMTALGPNYWKKKVKYAIVFGMLVLLILILPLLI